MKIGMYIGWVLANMHESCAQQRPRSPNHVGERFLTLMCTQKSGPASPCMRMPTQAPGGEGVGAEVSARCCLVSFS